MLNQEFLSIAADANQDTDNFRGGESQMTYFRIDTLQEAKKILSQATLEERIKRSETFLDGLEYRSRISQGMHDRGEAYVFANHPLETEKDDGGHRNHLPIYVRTFSIPEKTVAEGEIWDITMHPEEWGVDEKEEMYNIVNIGKLNLEKNAIVIVRGNALILTCQELIKKVASINEFDIGILGTPHGFGFRKGDIDGCHGCAGKNGFTGDHGKEPAFGANFLGKVLHPTFDPESLHGTSGEDGRQGGDGEDGLNGGACRIAEINIRSLVGTIPLVIGAISGNGGNGGQGGNGGNGGNGGIGVDSVKTFNKTFGPGRGGPGGNGGNGGHGGKAGHNGISSNVFVNIPKQSIGYVQCFSRAGTPGIPGKGGLPGSGGTGGLSGRNLDSQREEEAKSGKNGLPGRDGKEGRNMPKAKIYINNEFNMDF